MKLLEPILAEAAAIQTLRRDIHAHPELGFEEQRTSDLIASTLTAWGIPVHRGLGKTGVVGIVAPAEPALLGLVSRTLPALVGGNTVVVIASDAHPLAAIELAECVATADVPAGVVNILTGLRSELAPVLASHMDVAALDLSGADGDATELEKLGAENVKRIVRGRVDGESLHDIGALMELKTVWHPIGM